MKTSPKTLVISTSSFVALFLLIVQIPQYCSGQGLEPYKWTNRVLLLVDTKFDSPELQAQLQLFQDQIHELKDRDLILFSITGTEVRNIAGNTIEMDNTELRKSLNIEEGFSGVLLIGKDGWVKLREPFELTAQRIFDLIDSMPMRKAELKTRG